MLGQNPKAKLAYERFQIFLKSQLMASSTSKNVKNLVCTMPVQSSAQNIDVWSILLEQVTDGVLR